MPYSVISVEHLSKSYRLGQIGTGSLVYDLDMWWAKARGKPNPMLKIGQEDFGNQYGESIWALRDVSFTVQEGEVLGIIGRNGAGKSTLLKILSRVTAPTEGRIRLKGRVASLLEVGTGFHPELTGRENIYLNGAILGMSRQEITKKFDEILAFAEVEQFVDTPVKRYSSGMYVRLAFAVAAHLDAQILLVDEVLAVGDAEFQMKCLGKMGDVSSEEGRTILFVSHNMGAVRQLCPRSVLINHGEIVNQGNTNAIIRDYLEHTDNTKKGIGSLVFDSILVKDLFISQGNFPTNVVVPDNDFNVHIKYEMTKSTRDVLLGFELVSERGAVVFRTYDIDTIPLKQYRFGQFESIFTMPPNFLRPGNYYLNLIVSIHRKTRLDKGRLTTNFRIEGIRENDVDYSGDVVSPGTWQVAKIEET